MQAIFGLSALLFFFACQPSSQQNPQASRHSELSSESEASLGQPSTPALPEAKQDTKELSPKVEEVAEAKAKEVDTVVPAALDQNEMQTAAAGKVTVSSSCGFTGFRIQLKTDAGTLTSAIQSFTNCDKVATKINGLVLPTGKTTEALKGGRTIQASCELERLHFTVTADGTSSAIVMDTTQEKVCLELRNAINGLKL